MKELERHGLARSIQSFEKRGKKLVSWKLWVVLIGLGVLVYRLFW